MGQMPPPPGALIIPPPLGVVADWSSIFQTSVNGEMKDAGQPLQNFRAFINAMADAEEYEGPEGDSDGWRLGPQLRTRGSLHSDTWTGSAAGSGPFYLQWISGRKLNSSCIVQTWSVIPAAMNGVVGWP